MDYEKRINFALIQMERDGFDLNSEPAEITDQLRKFSVEINADPLIRSVPVCPLEGLHSGRCFDNCIHVAEIMGGKVIYGWAWHQLRNLLVVAEFHAVWESHDGKLVHPTPPPFPRPSTTFSADPMRVAKDLPADLPPDSIQAIYKNSEPNRRFPLKDDQDVHEWICSEEANAILREKRLNNEPLSPAKIAMTLERSVNARARLIARIRRMPKLSEVKRS